MRDFNVSRRLRNILCLGLEFRMATEFVEWCDVINLNKNLEKEEGCSHQYKIKAEK